MLNTFYANTAYYILKLLNCIPLPFTDHHKLTNIVLLFWKGQKNKLRAYLSSKLIVLRFYKPSVR